MIRENGSPIDQLSLNPDFYNWNAAYELIIWIMCYDENQSFVFANLSYNVFDFLIINLVINHQLDD